MSKKFKKVARNVYQVSAKTSQELAKLFVRFQEHYESPEFKGKIFTLAEFEEWYKVSRNAVNFTYYEDWSGFNVPDSVVEFVARNFTDLTEDEQWLIAQIRKAQPEGGRYYVIGAAKGSPDTLKHEIAHAMFYLDQGYRWGVGKLLRKNEEILEDLGEHLRYMGYDDSVVEDEKHAYILTERDYLTEQKLWFDQFDMIHRQISTLFERHK